MAGKGWVDVVPGKNPICLIGAGFSTAAIKCPIPSTSSIINEAVNTHSNDFPMLKALVQKHEGTSKSSLSLDQVWRYSLKHAIELEESFDSILTDYDSLHNQRFLNFLNVYKDQPPKTILWVLLGLELKKMIAFYYGNMSKVEFSDNIKLNLGCFIKKTKNIFWVSLNYDLILEFLLTTIKKRSRFTDTTKDISYAYSPLLSNSPILSNPKHCIIKPHGSINVSFDTIWDYPSAIHTVHFANRSNLLQGFDWQQIGYSSSSKPYTESRPWLIGYVPDFMKDELNSPVLYSDIAHDLFKFNMATFALKLHNASAILILGYSMPADDEWIWVRMANIFKKAVPIYVASRGSTPSIVHRLNLMGFNNVFELNSGII
jgi:hypothetical protein